MSITRETGIEGPRERYSLRSSLNTKCVSPTRTGAHRGQERSAQEAGGGWVPRPDGTRRCGMRWLMEFYNERRGILARYSIEAPLPAAAVLSGRNAVLAEYPSTPRRSRLSLFERAERVGGQDASGWVLYRIVKDNGQGSTGVAPAHAT